jgi:tellurite resistance protein TerC/cation:H+ antiporter
MLAANLQNALIGTTFPRMAEKNAHEMLQKIRHKLRLDKIHWLPRKIIVGVVGGICFIGGVVMIFTPGPAIVFIPLGLLLLASEFKWAERWAQKCMDLLHKGREKWRARKRRRPASAKS